MFDGRLSRCFKMSASVSFVIACGKAVSKTVSLYSLSSIVLKNRSAYQCIFVDEAFWVRWQFWHSMILDDVGSSFLLHL